MHPNFDLNRYAQVQEHGLVSGGYQGPGPNGLCVMQAYTYCMRDSASPLHNRASFYAKIQDPDFSESLQNRIINFNNNVGLEDAKGPERRAWLLSILPELYRFDELLAEKTKNELSNREISAEDAGLCSTPDLIEV